MTTQEPESVDTRATQIRYSDADNAEARRQLKELLAANPGNETVMRYLDDLVVDEDLANKATGRAPRE